MHQGSTVDRQHGVDQRAPAVAVQVFDAATSAIAKHFAVTRDLSSSCGLASLDGNSHGNLGRAGDAGDAGCYAWRIWSLERITRYWKSMNISYFGGLIWYHIDVMSGYGYPLACWFSPVITTFPAISVVLVLDPLQVRYISLGVEVLGAVKFG